MYGHVWEGVKNMFKKTQFLYITIYWSIDCSSQPWSYLSSNLPVYSMRTINPKYQKPAVVFQINPTTIETVTKQQKLKNYHLQKVNHT